MSKVPTSTCVPLGLLELTAVLLELLELLQAEARAATATSTPILVTLLGMRTRPPCSSNYYSLRDHSIAPCEITPCTVTRCAVTHSKAPNCPGADADGGCRQC